MGANWITSVLGYASLLTTWLNQVFIEQGIPQTAAEWKVFLIGNLAGLIGVFAKDFNKSNAANPTAVPQRVE